MLEPVHTGVYGHGLQVYGNLSGSIGHEIDSLPAYASIDMILFVGRGWDPDKFSEDDENPNEEISVKLIPDVNEAYQHYSTNKPKYQLVIIDGGSVNPRDVINFFRDLDTQHDPYILVEGASPTLIRELRSYKQAGVDRELGDLPLNALQSGLESTIPEPLRAIHMFATGYRRESNSVNGRKVA